MRIRHRRRYHETQLPEPGINLTPLLDVIFNLIFFFILATTIKESRAFMEVKLPASQYAAPTQAPKAIAIHIDAENQVFVEQEKVDVSELGEFLKGLQESQPGASVVVQGDVKVELETLVKVLDSCLYAELFVVSIEVRPESPPPE